MNENAGAQVLAGFLSNISAGPPDESAQTLTFFTLDTNPALFAVQPAFASDGTLTYTPADNANGSASISANVYLHGDCGE